MSDSYSEFLEKKAIVHVPTGITKKAKIPKRLFPFQGACTELAIRRGRSGLFESTGLGKSGQEIVFADNVERHTKKPVIIFTPLAVAQQMIEEGNALGIQLEIASGDEDIRERGIYIINYQKLHKIDPGKFSGVVLDEASCLKGYDRSTARRLIEMFAKTPFRLVATATPAPNDTGELGAYAEFLGVMSMSEMLSTFFVHDSGETQKWRLKGHAEHDFWRWLASWCVCIQKPSDIGFDDDGYILPKLHIKEHIAEAGLIREGELFAFTASTLQERRGARRDSISHRVVRAKELVDARPGEQWVIWCGLNQEQDEIARVLGDSCVSIQGSTSDDDKILLHEKWKRGEVKVLVTKVALFGFGLNWQHCRNMIFLGLSDSFEAFYQAVRRCWRFGQKNEVYAHVVISDSEGAVMANIKRKERDAENMQAALVEHMADITKKEISGVGRTMIDYVPRVHMQIPEWLVEETV